MPINNNIDQIKQTIRTLEYNEQLYQDTTDKVRRMIRYHLFKALRLLGVPMKEYA